MKIVQIGDRDMIGNKFNGHDLHRYLREQNHEAYHLVREKSSDDPYTFVYQRRSSKESFTKNLFYEPLITEADVLHFHQVHNLDFDCNLLPLLSGMKPVVWTLHDPWLFSGHCIHSFGCDKWRTGCGDCPHLDVPFSRDFDRSAIDFEAKRIAIRDSQITFIVASDWMLEKAKCSPVTAGKKIVKIPFGIDQGLFKCKSRADIRRKLGIAEDAFVLFFRADRNPYKGADTIKTAQRRLKTDRHVVLLSVGETDLLDEFKGRFEVVSRPWLKDDEKLAELYQASDVFLMPSVQEAFGMMAIEAMSCGKPVLAIEGTALPAVIHSPDCGLAVPAEHYPEMLQYWTDHPDEVEKRSMVSYEYARANYGKDLYISRVLAVYQEAVRDFRPLKNAEYIWSQIRKYPPQVKPEEAALQQAWLELERLQARHESLLNTKTMRLLNGIRRCFGMNELK